jgi:hypothetical protein
MYASVYLPAEQEGNVSYCPLRLLLARRKLRWRLDVDTAWEQVFFENELGTGGQVSLKPELTATFAAPLSFLRPTLPPAKPPPKSLSTIHHESSLFLPPLPGLSRPRLSHLDFCKDLLTHFPDIFLSWSSAQCHTAPK